MPLNSPFPFDPFAYGFGDDVVTGNRFYVDSGATNASDDNLGTSPTVPLATLDGAVNKCTANNGDHIYLMPGHAETISADAATTPGPDINVAGVTVIGMGNGSDRPTFTFDNTAADFKINVANGIIHNLLFLAGVASQVMGVEVSGVDGEVGYCEFRNTSAFEMLIALNIGIASNDSDRLNVHHNRFISDTAGSTSAISMTALQAGVRIENNYIRGDYSDAAVQSAVVHTDCVVKDNYIQNDNNTSHAIQFSTTSTGIIRDNVLVTDAIATALDQGSCFATGNQFYDDGDTDTGGSVIPTTAGTGAVGFASITALHAVPSQDATTDVNVRDVVGKKNDTASPVPATTDSLVSYAKGSMAGTVRVLAKTAATVLNGDDPLFTIVGAPIHILSITGYVSGAAISGAATMHLNMAVTTPAADISLSTAVAIDSDADGTIYHFLGDGGVLTPESTGVVFLPLDDAADGTDKPTQWLVPPGTIEASGSAARTGAIIWVMAYYNNPAATVTVAA